MKPSHTITQQPSDEQAEMLVLGARLRVAREEAGLTLEAAARSLVLRPGAVKRIEEGRLPGVLKLREMLVLYAQSPHKLLFGGGAISLTADQADELRMIAAAASPQLQAKLGLMVALFVPVEPR